LAFVPEWAPPHENHILYSKEVLKNVSYGKNSIRYTTTVSGGTEFLKLSFKPKSVTLNGEIISAGNPEFKQRYVVKPLAGGDYWLEIKSLRPGNILIE
jgi:23S rRNA maturation-related 3'-5' exoribonuclease YhaM